jgi:hypothetical protein
MDLPILQALHQPAPMKREVAGQAGADSKPNSMFIERTALAPWWRPPATFGLAPMRRGSASLAD